MDFDDKSFGIRYHEKSSSCPFSGLKEDWRRLSLLQISQIWYLETSTSLPLSLPANRSGYQGVTKTSRGHQRELSVSAPAHPWGCCRLQSNVLSLSGHPIHHPGARRSEVLNFFPTPLSAHTLHARRHLPGHNVGRQTILRILERSTALFIHSVDHLTDRARKRNRGRYKLLICSCNQTG